MIGICQGASHLRVRAQSSSGRTNPGRSPGSKAASTPSGVETIVPPSQKYSPDREQEKNNTPTSSAQMPTKPGTIRPTRSSLGSGRQPHPLTRHRLPLPEDPRPHQQDQRERGIKGTSQDPALPSLQGAIHRGHLHPRWRGPPHPPRALQRPPTHV